MQKNKSTANSKPTKHELEMAILRAYHERLLQNKALRAATLVSSGVFARSTNGELVVAKPYDKVIVPKQAAK